MKAMEAIQQTIVPPFDFNIIYLLLKEHASLACLAVILFLAWKYAGSIGLYFKEYFNKKSDNESKRLSEITKINDRHFSLYENNTLAVNKIGDAIANFEKAFVGSEARTSEKILGSEARVSEKILGVEARLTEKISTSAKDITRASYDSIQAKLTQ